MSTIHERTFVFAQNTAKKLRSNRREAGQGRAHGMAAVTPAPPTPHQAPARLVERPTLPLSVTNFLFLFSVLQTSEEENSQQGTRARQHTASASQQATKGKHLGGDFREGYGEGFSEIGEKVFTASLSHKESTKQSPKPPLLLELNKKLWRGVCIES